MKNDKQTLVRMANGRRQMTTNNGRWTMNGVLCVFSLLVYYLYFSFFYCITTIYTGKIAYYRRQMNDDEQTMDDGRWTDDQWRMDHEGQTTNGTYVFSTSL